MRLRDRFQRAVDEGDLPPDTDPRLLAHGDAVQAVSSTTRNDLQQVAEMALRSWPPA